MSKRRYVTLEEYSNFCRKNFCDCAHCRLWKLCPFSEEGENLQESDYPADWSCAYEMSRLMGMSDERYLRYCLTEFKNDEKSVPFGYDEWCFEQMQMRLSAFKTDCKFYSEIYIVSSKLSSDLLENDYEPRNLDYLSKYLKTEIRKILRRMKEARND